MVMVLVFFSVRVERIRVENVEEDGEERASGVDSESDPPYQVFVKFLFKVFQNEKADSETGKSSCQVGHVRDWRHTLIGSIPVVNGETYIGTR